MKDKTYYTTGEFANRAKVSIRTIRYYDKQGILKPTHMSESGYRLYTDSDFAKLQKVLSLKLLGFTLDEIIDISHKDSDRDYIKQSFSLQLQLVKKKMEQLQLMEQSINEANKVFEEKKEIDWNQIIGLIHITNMEKDLTKQYKNSLNIDVRIHLHKEYSVNPLGWFQWIYRELNITKSMKILEIGCGNGELWKVNQEMIPNDCEIVLSDISAGMLNDAKDNLKNIKAIEYKVIDCHEIPYQNETFDIVIANHVLFYLKDRDKALNEINRVLKKGGYFYCSTYGKEHMKEIDQMVKEFDNRIALSLINLYDIFGLEDGKLELNNYFSSIDSLIYEDYLLVDKEQPLIDYILSCHGNQQEFIKEKYDEFYKFMKDKMKKKGKIKITKMAGIFRCKKEAN
jgi:DNA-binding transcriptional MerR regulator/phospholipid N-methyltransferase